ncbi:MAG: hypothetical protein DMG69_19075 [Acidobacteria bacterium]|nr:MAG: hypothetical protein DMG69_19075 [Acidobacteriota bacterium]
MAERRAHRRSRMVLPIKVSLPGTPHLLAHTIDISISGARIGGLREQLQPGKIISLQRTSQRAKFRIVWVRQVGPGEIHAGVEAVDSHNNFWGIDLSQADADAKKGTEVLMELLKSSKARAVAAVQFEATTGVGK